MGKSRRISSPRKKTTRSLQKPGYAELALYGAQSLPKGRKGRPLWQPIDTFLEQLEGILIEKGEAIGPQIEFRTRNAINTFKLRGLLLVNYKTRMLRITQKGREFISDALSDVPDMETSDQQQFRVLCAALKRALTPLQHRTKQEVIEKYELLLNEVRAPEGFDSGYESDGTDTDSEMAEVMVEDSSFNAVAGPSTEIPRTPAPRPLLRQGTAMDVTTDVGVVCNTTPAPPTFGDPCIAYPTPTSVPRRLAPEQTQFFTPPSSPTFGSHSQIIVDEDYDQVMDVDDMPPLDQHSIDDLNHQIQTLNEELEKANESKEILEDNIADITRQAVASEISRKLLRMDLQTSTGQMEWLRHQNSCDAEIAARRIEALRMRIERLVRQEHVLATEQARLTVLLDEREQEVRSIREGISSFSRLMTPAVGNLSSL
ncbi:hypothetical protein Hypma_003720 [Hypsizygus marmoreus]|uniref:Uncharacterized protein n=1 Tax=Hypsizygus marmoreus TaxID=39966 RepID=A0A369J190_HYPMA|nr:hypothetical protein Hypma_003720 [Hypsizygus marmoreus]